MFPDSTILENLDSLAFTLKGYSDSSPFAHGDNTGKYTIKWLTQWLTRNKMRPKKATGRLRQFEFFFSLTYHAIVTSHVVEPGICPVLIQNRPGFRSCHRHLRVKV